MPRTTKIRKPKKVRVPKPKRITKKQARAEAVAAGFRSKFEFTISKQLVASGATWGYEQEVLKYEVPSYIRRYLPDFHIAKNGVISFFIEAKGRLVAADRRKMVLVRDQNPTVDIRFVFQNADVPIYKGSDTTAGEWATKNNFVWAEGSVPQEWLDE